MRLKKLLPIAALGLLSLVPFSAAPAQAQIVESRTRSTPRTSYDFGYSTYYSHPSRPVRYGYAGIRAYPRGHWAYRRLFVAYPWPHWITRRVWVGGPGYRY